MPTKAKSRRPINRRARFPARQWEIKYSKAIEPKLTTYSRKLVDKLQSAGVIDKFSAYLLTKYDKDPEQVRNAIRRDDYDPRVDQSKFEQLARKVLRSLTVDVSGIVERYTKDIWKAGSKHAFSKLGIEATWNIRSPQVERSIKTRVNLIKDATDFQAKRVLSTIRQVVYENGGHPLAAENIAKIKSAVGDISEERARTIARTETLAVQSEAARTTYEENGLATEWLYSQSGYERHMSLDGQVVAAGAKFVAEDGTELAYPGDPSAPAGMSANCMCALMPVVTSDFDRSAVVTGD